MDAVAPDNARMSAPCPAPETIAVIDFETTGMGPGQGARATEIAVVLVREGRIVDRYASHACSGNTTQLSFMSLLQRPLKVAIIFL